MSDEQHHLADNRIMEVGKSLNLKEYVIEVEKRARMLEAEGDLLNAAGIRVGAEMAIMLDARLRPLIDKARRNEIDNTWPTRAASCGIASGILTFAERNVEHGFVSAFVVDLLGSVVSNLTEGAGIVDAGNLREDQKSAGGLN